MCVNLFSEVWTVYQPKVNLSLDELRHDSCCAAKSDLVTAKGSSKCPCKFVPLSVIQESTQVLSEALNQIVHLRPTTHFEVNNVSLNSFNLSEHGGRETLSKIGDLSTLVDRRQTTETRLSALSASPV